MDEKEKELHTDKEDISACYQCITHSC